MTRPFVIWSNESELANKSFSPQRHGGLTEIHREFLCAIFVMNILATLRLNSLLRDLIYLYSLGFFEKPEMFQRPSMFL